MGDAFLNNDAAGFTETALAYNLGVVIRANRMFGLEVGAHNAGSGVESLFERDSVKFENKYLVATGQFALKPNIFVLLKAGGMQWHARADGDYFTGDGPASRDGSSAMMVTALGWKINKRFALDINHLFVDMTDDFDIKIVSVNFTYSFFGFKWGS